MAKEKWFPDREKQISTGNSLVGQLMLKALKGSSNRVPAEMWAVQLSELVSEIVEQWVESESCNEIRA